MGKSFSMFYSDTDILEAMELGVIEIDPYDEGQLGPNSYDVRLGNWFYEVFWDSSDPYFVGPIWHDDGQQVEIPYGGLYWG